MAEKRGRVTRGRAIRLKCLDCAGDSASEVKRCPVTDCPLWPFRLGREVGAAGAETGQQSPAGE